ncbi:hypothetical protein [Nonomuraea diastatica]|uniref:Uncharacterized protein n=1 Tax=Nonomuraea diastatica TaxID=1848329 RepID=A0A4R4X283_9ACTN|nr:hypothetical protein [Nonomuraea diastatica]TDD24302.1 hypothetical protein E1294_06055 [Nonomuraea diastatica]
MSIDDTHEGDYATRRHTRTGVGLTAGFLLFLATSDILPEAHTTRQATGWTLAATVARTLFMWSVIGLTD